MATILQLRHDRAGVSDCEQLRGEAGAALSATTMPTLDARHTPVSLAVHLWGTGCASAGEENRVCFVRTLSESRMLEIGTSGLMSGERKRAGDSVRTASLLDSTAPLISTKSPGNRTQNEPAQPLTAPQFPTHLLQDAPPHAPRYHGKESPPNVAEIRNQ